MTTELTCTVCGAVNAFGEEDAGRMGKCGRCQTPLYIPRQEELPLAGRLHRADPAGGNRARWLLVGGLAAVLGVCALAGYFLFVQGNHLADAKETKEGTGNLTAVAKESKKKDSDPLPAPQQKPAPVPEPNEAKPIPAKPIPTTPAKGSFPRKIPPPKELALVNGQVRVKGRLSNGDARIVFVGRSCYCKKYLLHMSAGKTYRLAMKTTAVDSCLRLEDIGGGQLAVNNEAGSNARIVFACSKTGTYRIFAASPVPNTGTFSLEIQELAGNEKS